MNHRLLLCSAATVAGLCRFHFRTRSGVECKVVSWFDESLTLKKRRTNKMAYKLNFETLNLWLSGDKRLLENALYALLCSMQKLVNKNNEEVVRDLKTHISSSS